MLNLEKEILKPNRIAINITILTIPSPPTSINKEKIILPKIVNELLKSLTGERPVTHTADVDKNKALI